VEGLEEECRIKKIIAAIKFSRKGHPKIKNKTKPTMILIAFKIFSLILIYAII
jgi:hypothetical protein